MKAPSRVTQLANLCHDALVHTSTRVLRDIETRGISYKYSLSPDGLVFRARDWLCQNRDSMYCIIRANKITLYITYPLYFDAAVLCISIYVYV